MQSFGPLIRVLRKKAGYPLRKVAAYLDIDQAVLSKVERGIRRLNKEQVVKLARLFRYSEKELLVAYLSDLIIYEVGNEEYARDALKVAERKIEYQKFIAQDRSEIIRKIKNRLKHFPNVINAWIYGSFSRHDDGPGSDIDIALKTEKSFSYFDLAEIQYQLENELHRSIDLGFIDSFKDQVFKKVKPDLKLIYER
jgi:predicted nucleotidyltransferase